MSERKRMYATVYNTTDAPITVDGEGRQIGGRDWGTADTTGVAKDALAAGALVQVEVGAKDVHPDAAAAAERTQQISARAEQLQDVDKDVLAAAAAEADVPAADEMSKPELVAALAARADVPIPEATPQDEQAPDEAEPPAERKSRRS